MEAGGRGGPRLRATAVPVPTVANAPQVACGTNTTAAVTTDGRLYTWGSCEYFSLGHGDKVTSTVYPLQVEALAGITIVKVAISC